METDGEEIGENKPEVILFPPLDSTSLRNEPSVTTPAATSPNLSVREILVFVICLETFSYQLPR